MILRIDHETTLTYTDQVYEHVFELRMAPVSNDEQTTLGYRLRITPLTTSTPFRDGHGNRVELINIIVPSLQIIVRTTSFVRTHRQAAAERLRGVVLGKARTRDAGSIDAMDYLAFSSLVDHGYWLNELAQAIDTRDELPMEFFLQQAMQLVFSRLHFEKTCTSISTKASEALRLGAGVCQDFTHLLLAVCRHIGLPARYVSGYIHEPGEIATHAWVQVWCGSDTGWLDIDPTHQCFAAEDHVQVAVGRDYADVPPNRGAWRGIANENIQVSVRVEPVPRLPGEWVEAESLPHRGSIGESTSGTHTKGVARPTGRQFQRMLYRQQQQQQ
ncbi:MAG: transglutaminase family protein [Planctomycetota bacterium]|nr:transglutaminase family protein [Planctomycetota bacterium]